MIPYFVGFDRVNYICSIVTDTTPRYCFSSLTPTTCGSKIYKWCFQSTSKLCSTIKIDQANTQNNILLNGYGGDICLTEDCFATIDGNWTRSQKTDRSSGLSHSTADERHDEDASKRFKIFLKSCDERVWKPFLEESSNLYKIDSINEFCDWEAVKI